jgi:hypothetical protein
MNARPDEVVPTTRVFRPSGRLTQAQVGCLKTAVALVVIQRRLKARRTHLRRESFAGQGEPGPSSVLAQILVPARTTQSGESSSADCNEITVAGSEEVGATRRNSKGLKDWVAHMDHMMAVAVRNRMDPGKAKQYRAVIAHIASQLTSIVAPTASGPESYIQEQHDADVSTVKEWIYSYLVVTDEALGDLWTEIVFESQYVRSEHTHDSPPTTPDLIVSCLVVVLQDCLNLNTRLALRKGEDFFNLRLLASLLPLVCLEAMNDCWLHLEAGHTPVAASYATQYFDMCRQREAIASGPLAASSEASGKLTDVSRVLFLRRELSEVFADMVKSSTETYSFKSFC